MQLKVREREVIKRLHLGVVNDNVGVCIQPELKGGYSVWLCVDEQRGGVKWSKKELRKYLSEV